MICACDETCNYEKVKVLGDLYVELSKLGTAVVDSAIVEKTGRLLFEELNKELLYHGRS